MRYLGLVLLIGASPLPAQHHHGAAERAMSAPPDSVGRLHLRMTPLGQATSADSARARAVATELRLAIARYADTAAATRDGYRMFAPQLRTQKTFHFTKNSHALKEAFRFDPSKPTSLLYERDSTGRIRLVGAMYTMPKRARPEKLDRRIPLSIAQWHQHVNWCVPDRKQQSRWLETQGGRPVFGPESPIATKAACEKVGGEFRENVFGWMVHANVFAGEDLGAIFGHGH